MGKFLTFEEKMNAENEYLENKNKIKLLQNEINKLKYRNNRLLRCIYFKKKSKHNGMYGIDGVCFTVFHKRFRELTPQERSEYNKIMKRRERAKK